MGQESKIEEAVCTYARQRGCYVRKFTSPSHAGVPDHLFLTPAGVVFFVEFKAPGQEPTALQTREIREICKRHGNADWVTSIESGKYLVDKFLRIEVL